MTCNHLISANDDTDSKVLVSILSSMSISSESKLVVNVLNPSVSQGNTSVEHNSVFLVFIGLLVVGFGQVLGMKRIIDYMKSFKEIFTLDWNGFVVAMVFLPSVDVTVEVIFWIEQILGLF